MVADLDSFVRSYGIDPIWILTEVPFRATHDRVLLSGSLVDGFGNCASDIDIIVVGPALSRRVRPFFLGCAGRWIDVDIWEFAQLKRLIDRGRVASEVPGNLGEYAPLRYHQAIALHRFSIAIDITRPPASVPPLSRLEPHRLRRAMAGYHLMNARNLWQDAAGAFASQKREDASYLAAMGLESCFDTMAALAGETNPNDKWRIAKMKRLIKTPSIALPIRDSFTLMRGIGALAAEPRAIIRAFAKELFESLCMTLERRPVGLLPELLDGERYEIIHDEVYRIFPDTTMVPMGIDTELQPNTVDA